jgi:hypothetical protein
MSRFFVAVALTAAGLALCPGIAAASHSADELQMALNAASSFDPAATISTGAGHDFAVGGGQTAAFSFGFAAHSGPAGEDPMGHVNFRHRQPNNPDFNGTVTCHVVTGNTAAIGGEAEIVFPPFGNFGGFLFEVVDNRRPVQGASLDLLSPVFLLPGPPPQCAPTSGGEFPLEAGNVVVHDAG